MRINKTILFSFLLSLCAPLFMTSCMDDGMGYELGEDMVDDDSRIVMVDTVSINVSTFMLDSLITTNTERVVVGNLNDPYVGKTQTQTRLQFLCNFYPTMDNTAVFDSINLEMHSDGYFYGDTLNMQEVKVYPLKEFIDPDDYSDDANTFYNVNSIDYDVNKLLGEKLFRPSYNKDSVLRVPLSKDLGKRLFDLAFDKNDSLVNVDEFKDILPGLVLVPGEQSQLVTGFAAPLDSISSGKTPPQIVVYYHDKIDDETKSFVINYTLPDYMYNTFTSDFEGGVLEGLKHDNEVTLSSKDIGDVSYVQGGNGLVTRLNFRNMKDLQYIGPGMVASAVLILKPLQGSYNDDNLKLPKMLAPYIVDKKNKILTPLLADDGETPIMGYLYEDPMFQDNTEYRIDITSFIKSEFREEKEWDRSLILQLPSVDENRAVDRLILDHGNKNNIELELYYIVSELD
ncbi:DUF4270 domain-containing protein [Halosquirtibacter laminarini]|uniref:DUF4270 domain-containing protein n=1 Tax=Halosquirtibacter laminarini TaxID=3374600 RepID=A0AC61NP75_9BACT|nr:DUF4270 domain-containing protein [Prolixibacteraceae bacterium]